MLPTWKLFLLQLFVGVVCYLVFHPKRPQYVYDVSVIWAFLQKISFRVFKELEKVLGDIDWAHHSSINCRCNKLVAPLVLCHMTLTHLYVDSLYWVSAPISGSMIRLIRSYSDLQFYAYIKGHLRWYSPSIRLSELWTQLLLQV